MHDLKYPDGLLLQLHPRHLATIAAAGHETIFSGAVSAFTQSMDQIRLLALIPEFFVRATAKQIIFDVASMYEALGKPFPSGPVTEEQWERIAQIKQRKLDEQLAITDHSIIEAQFKKDVIESSAHLRRLCSASEGTPETLSAVECLLISLLLQTWTAFESLTTDVWIAALNLGPKSFCKRVANYKGAQSKEQQAKSILITSLERFNFDLTNSMGSLLKEKFDFARLRNIKTAYITAFGKETEPLFDTNNLNPANNAAHEAIRNVFAHRGGRADGQFRYLVSKCPASEYYWLRDLKDDEKVKVDGAMVYDLWLSTCATATALVILVNKKINDGDADS